ncbi:hypothetical protein P7H62_14365 [Vagococcus carniphilus]|uniref:hypothetical protein n=1 Tax=Vagococcus carniphilus TaxID=218144 RepID=UPI00288C8BA3|nr:hypothetical protein [Vagococcus carniphilus]MDT2830050.1 hypothetical protein [Vagococcus carniphilus]MDT2838484.1 hypothetical protein [Vagococcus carniphilus]MDT2855646.1 hypothetical protein [Vagococcus carniphilus]
MFNKLLPKVTKHILELEKLQEQLNEIEDLKVSLETPALNNLKEIMTDVSLSVPTFNVNNQYRPLEERVNTRWHEVKLEEDLGITDIQSLIKELLIDSLNDRKRILEKEIELMISQNQNIGVNY